MRWLDGIFDLFDRFIAKSDGRRRLRDGDTLLASVKDGELIAHTFDVVLSHAEFVKRSLGSLPDGAWVGTIRKSGRQVIAVNSRTFYGNQLPAPQTVLDVVKKHFR